MAIATYKPQRKNDFTTPLIYAAVIIGLGLVIYLAINVLGNFGIVGGKARLVVDAHDGTANVFLNNELIGTTPLDYSEVKAGEQNVRIENSLTSYEASLSFLGNSETVIFRDLGVSNVFSSGQNIWVEKSRSDTVLNVVSEPAGAKVFIEGTEVGATPYSSSSLSDGEYQIRIDRPGYEAQLISVHIQKGSVLNASIKLFPVPVPSTVTLLEGSTNIYDVVSNDAVVTSDSANWASAVAYWNRTRGVKLGEAVATKEPVFDYFIDYNGRIYSAIGEDITGATELTDVTYGAYLRRASDGPGMSPAAVSALENLSIVTNKTATVLATGTGWLNLRSEPSLNGSVVQQLNTGESFLVLEERSGWVKLRVSAEVEGWVSSTYVSVQ